MKKYNVLIFPCGTEIANEVINSLQHHKYFNCFYASSEKITYCNYKDVNVIHIPFVFENNFIKILINIIKKNNINFIIPCHDDVALKLSEIQNIINSINNCKIIGQSYEINNIIRYKDKTYNYLKNFLPVPVMYNFNEIKTKDYPIFVKPIKGQGSLNAVKLLDDNQLKIFANEFKINEFVIMEYLPGKEYTIDCFSDNGELIFFGPRERKKTFNGISIFTELLLNTDKKYKEIEKYSKLISKILKMHGAWFFQMKEDKNKKLKLLEIGTRISGTMMLNRIRGINFVELSLYQALGEKIEILINKFHASLYRSLIPKYKIDIKYDFIYVDLDDCLIVENKINTRLITLLYDSFNKNKKVILITKHNNDDVYELLKKFRLLDLFDKIIHIKKDEEKTNYIKHKNAIFIDDSFFERKKVLQKLGIPVFSVDAIECLL